ncbi:MAG: fumarate reductase subunit C [Succinivibrio sp.]|nr:fumarate reductase subunit C [Succinivibrio sp.]
MSEAKSFRKPYIRPVSATTWWLKNPFYTKYMLREGTAVMALFATLEIVFGVFMFALSTDGDPQCYMWWVRSFLGNPVIILLNILALGAQIFHMITWFNLMPKAVRLFMNKNSTERVPDAVTKIGLYCAVAGATVVILVAAFATM